MPIPLPRLDNRRFDDLVRDGIALARESCPDWTDFTPGDPGVTLIEVFAFLTDALLYRLNRVPPKLQLALLNLVGVNLQPPSAASVDLMIRRTDAARAGKAITIPPGTTVATGDGSVEFVFPNEAVLPAGETETTARVLQCQLVEGELLGVSSGIAGQSFIVAKPPVIAPTLDGLDFMLGVESEETGAGRTIRQVEGVAYELWTEVPHFGDAAQGTKAYTLDRASGRVQFPPSASQGGGGAVPPAGRSIRAWYRRGGGRAGNVAAGMLTQLKPPIAGIEVVNPGRAGGGSDGESLDALIRRAPSCLYSLDVAVTARDYEQVVLSAGGIARASAVADAELWRHAERGVVVVRIVPEIDPAAVQNGGITERVVRDHRVPAVKDRAETALEARRPLGILTRVDWVKVRSVAVHARVIAAPGADLAAVEQGILRRINMLLSPLSDRPLGHQIRASEVYEQILAEPGVRYADRLIFGIDGVPKSDVVDLVRDPVQPGCWFAATRAALHRTLDDGDSWSIEFRRDGLSPRFVRRHPTIAGLMVLAVAKEKGTALYLSSDLGETWSEAVAQFNSEVHDAAWVDRNGAPTLILATAEGLRQFTPGGDSPSPIIVDKAIDAKGFYSVVSNVSPSGVVAVAVAARAGGGVHLSPLGGLSDTFHSIGLKDKPIRHLGVQATGARDFLWVTVDAEAGAAGEGAHRIELRANGQDDPGGFKAFNIGWQGGSCESLAFADNMVFGASNRGGVLALDVTAAKPSWQPVKLDAGLPIRDTERLLETVDAVAAAPRPGAVPVVLSGGPRGVHRSLDGGTTYECVSLESFVDRVPIPRGWLYAAGQHRIEVVREEEGRG